MCMLLTFLIPPKIGSAFRSNLIPDALMWFLYDEEEDDSDYKEDEDGDSDVDEDSDSDVEPQDGDEVLRDGWM